MELIRGAHNLRPRHRGCVATIGNFDGVHLGHQAVLGQLAEKAGDLGVPSLLITFEPHPREYFAPEGAPPRLTRLREKLQALRRYSVDRVLCLRFDRALATLSADEFVRRILVEGAGVRHLVIGDDFRFGRDREGDFEHLRAAGEREGFQVVRMHSFDIDGERVSSTRVREALARADFGAAEKLLGRRYRMCGRVAHGDRRGRAMGIPTANLHLHRHASPVQGVFAVEVFGVEGEPVAGAANVGTRPTVDGTRALLEIYLLDFDRDIYGRYLHVDFLHKLRDEERYETVEALRDQMLHDIDDTRRFFATMGDNAEGTEAQRSQS